MSTNIKLLRSNAKEFVKSLDNAKLNIIKGAMYGIGDYVDTVRQSAVTDFMVPNKYASQTFIRAGKNGAIGAWVWMTRPDGTKYQVRHSKLQKPDASKVTIRTGTLAAVIKQRGTWKISRDGSIARFGSSGRYSGNIKANTLPQWGAKSETLSYFTKLHFVPASNKNIDYRLKNEIGGVGRNGSGPARPFITPALNKASANFETIVWKKLKAPVNTEI